MIFIIRSLPGEKSYFMFIPLHSSGIQHPFITNKGIHKWEIMIPIPRNDHPHPDGHLYLNSSSCISNYNLTQ